MSAQASAGGHVAAHTHYRRFDRADRLLHGLLMFSFLGLAFTGPAAAVQPRAVGGDAGAILRRLRERRRSSTASARS